MLIFFAAMDLNNRSTHLEDPRGLLSPCQPTYLSQLLRRPIFHDVITVISKINSRQEDTDLNFHDSFIVAVAIE